MAIQHGLRLGRPVEGGQAQLVEQAVLRLDQSSGASTSDTAMRAAKRMPSATAAPCENCAVPRQKQIWKHYQ